jgi:hypothetical protein
MAQLVLRNILAGSGNVLAGGDNSGNVNKITIGSGLTLTSGVLSSSGGGSSLILTTIGTSGAATYSSITGVLNIPIYSAATGVVSSVFGRTGTVIAASGDYNTDLVTEGSTNLYYSNDRARSAFSATTPLSYNSTTGVFTISQASTSTNGYLSSTNFNAFNNKQAALNGTGFVKISGTTISYDNSTYLTTSSASSTYLPLSGGTLTGSLNGTSASFSASGQSLQLTSASDVYLNVTRGSSILNIGIDGTGSFYNTSSSHRFFTNSGTINALTIASTGAATFSSSVTASSLIKSGGTSSQFLKADGSTDSSAYITSSGSVAYATSSGSISGFNNPTTAGTANTIAYRDSFGYLYAIAFYEYSDIRFKNVLETNPIIDVNGIDVIKFNRKENASIRYGYSAQQVKEFVPEAVNGDNELLVNYSDIHTLKIAALERRILELENKFK